MMKTSQKGIDLIKFSEGCSLKPYLCPAGIPTIGYGSTFYANGKAVTMKDANITQKQAEQLLPDVLVGFEASVRRQVKVAMTQGQFDALVDFTFNLGEGNLSKSTLLKLLNAGDYAGAANQFAVWNKGTKNGKLEVLQGLVTRRASDKALFLS